MCNQKVYAWPANLDCLLLLLIFVHEKYAVDRQTIVLIRQFNWFCAIWILNMHTGDIAIAGVVEEKLPLIAYGYCAWSSLKSGCILRQTKTKTTAKCQRIIFDRQTKNTSINYDWMLIYSVLKNKFGTFYTPRTKKYQQQISRKQTKIIFNKSTLCK